jgi:hypothetical protein
VTAINGMDGIGHYLRAALIVNQCAGYAVQPVGGCSAEFTGASAASAGSAAKTAGISPAVMRSAVALNRALRREAAKARTNTATPAPATSTPAAAAPAATPAPAPTPAPNSSAGRQGALLDYLFGSDN